MKWSTIRGSLRATRAQAGDTIVEVLICIGVISLVLTGAFAVSNRSTNTVQDSNEHATASLYLQSQVEALRSYLRADGASLASVSAPFCMTAAGSPVPVTDASCTKSDPAGYKLSAKRDGNIYTFAVNWDSISGGKAQETFVYRDYL